MSMTITPGSDSVLTPWTTGPSVRRQWWLVTALTILTLLSSVDRHVISLLVGDIQASLHLSDTQISLLLGFAFAISYTLASIPAGYLADALPRRLVVAGAVILWSIMTMLCGFSGNYWQLFAARAGVGIGEGSLVPAALSLVRDGVDPIRRGRAITVVTAGPLAGTGLAVVLGGLLVTAIEHFGSSIPMISQIPPWQVTLGAIGLLGLPLVLLVLTIYEPSRAPRARGGADNGGLLKGYAAAFAHIRANGAVFFPLLVLSVFNGLLAGAFGAWMPSILRRSFHLTSGQIALGFGGLMIVAVPTGLFVAGSLMDRARHRSSRIGTALAGLIGMSFITVAATLAPLMPTTTLVWPVFALQLLMSGIPVAAVQLTIADNTPSHLVGKVIAVNVLALGVFGQSSGPTIAAMSGAHFFSGADALAYGLSLTAAVSGSIAVVSALLVIRAARRIPLAIVTD